MCLKQISWTCSYVVKDFKSYNAASVRWSDADAVHVGVADAINDAVAVNDGGGDNDDDIFNMWSGDERSGRLIADPSLPTTRATGLQNIGKVTGLQNMGDIIVLHQFTKKKQGFKTLGKF